MIAARTRLIASLVAASLLGALSVAVQVARDRRYATDRPEESVLYVRSPALLRRLVLSYDAIAADVYWIRAIQHFGRERQTLRAAANDANAASTTSAATPPADAGVGRARHAGGTQHDRYALLYPLLDLTTSLDSRFNLAYRFGAIFLSEQPPGGPGRPDLAIALLEKGIAAMPDKWQYYQDAGFVHYWTRHDYIAAADWFRRGSQVDGAPWWMNSLAANTLAVGGDRGSSRLLYAALLQSGENDFMKQDAARRLRQLDALEARDRLHEIVQRYRAGGGQPPLTWQALIAAGLLRETPRDPDGVEFAIDPGTGRVDVQPSSPLFPLPAEPPAALRPRA